jgi:cytochrome bd-type quinol oxidase subunit 2
MTRNLASEKFNLAPKKQPHAGGFVSRLLLLAAICALISLAVVTGFVALVQGAGAMPLPFNLHIVDERLPGIFKLHMLASGASLALMPLVILTRKRRGLHRALGRITAGFVIAGALTSFPVAYESVSPLIARLGFATQGTVWLALVVAGVVAIRRKDRARHATLMLAMVAVASGAVWVRLTTAAATSLDWPFDPVYSCATWLGWLVPLTLVLTIASRPRRPERKVGSPTAVAA